MTVPTSILSGVNYMLSFIHMCPGVASVKERCTKKKNSVDVMSKTCYTI